jgi:hypothetical protein
VQLLGVTGGSRITVGGAGVATSYQLARVDDLTLNSAAPISRILTTRWTDDDPLPDTITAPAIGSITTLATRLPSGGLAGGTFSADVNVTGGGVSIRSLNIGGVLDGATIRTAGDIGSVRLGAMNGAAIFAGVAPTVTSLPAAASDFAARATIRRFQVTSTGESHFSGTNRIAAWSVGSFRLNHVRAANGGETFGLSAVSVGSYSRGTGTPVRKARLTIPGVFDAAGDYVARIVA